MAYQGCNACTAAEKVICRDYAMELLKESSSFKSQNCLADSLTKNLLHHPKHYRANERTSESPASPENLTKLQLTSNYNAK